MRRSASILQVSVASLIVLTMGTTANGAEGIHVRLFHIPRALGGETAAITGPDGALWFTMSFAIAKKYPRGEIRKVVDLDHDSSPTDITVGPDGNLWFT